MHVQVLAVLGCVAYKLELPLFLIMCVFHFLACHAGVFQFSKEFSF